MQYDFFNNMSPTVETISDIPQRYSYLDFSGPTNYALQQDNPEFYQAHLDVSQNLANLANLRDYIQSQLIRNPSWASSISPSNPVSAPSRAVAPDAPSVNEGSAPAETSPTENTTSSKEAEKKADTVALNTPSSDNYSWLDSWASMPSSTPTPSTPEMPTAMAMEAPDVKVDADPLQLQTLNYEKPVENTIAANTEEPIKAEALSIPTIPAIDGSAVYEALAKKSRDMNTMTANAGIPTEPRVYEDIPISEYPVEKDFADSFVGDEMQSSGYYDDKGKLITDPNEIAKREDLELRKLIKEYAGLDGEITNGNLDAKQIKTIVANLDAIPENRSTLEKVLDWGSNFITLGARPDVPGRDIPLIKDARAFTEACADGQDPKKLADLAFQSAAGLNAKAGLEYYRITGDTNNNPYAELAQQDIANAYNDVLAGKMSEDDFTAYADKVLDSPWKNFNKVVLSDLKKNYTRGAAMAVGAGAGQVAGRVAQKVATKYPKVLSKIIQSNSKRYAQELVKDTNPAKLSKALQNGGFDKKLADKAAETFLKDPEKAQQLFEKIAERIGNKSSTSEALQKAAEELFVKTGQKVGGALVEEAVDKAKEVIGNATGKAVAGLTAAAPTVAGTIAAGVASSNEEAEAMQPPSPEQMMKLVEENRDELTNENLKPVQQLLMGESDFDDVFTRMLGQFDFEESNTKAGQKFEEATNNFRDKAKEVWNDEDKGIVRRTAGLIKETYKYAKEMKSTLLNETAGGKISSAWYQMTMDILRIIFQGYALSNGYTEAYIMQLLSNADRTGLIDQILEWGVDLDDETRQGLEGLKDPGSILQPDQPDIQNVQDEEIQRYDTNARDDSTLYNKGLKKEAYSDENVKDFISRVIPHEPILLKVTRFL